MEYEKMEQKDKIKRKNQVFFVKTNEQLKGKVVCAANLLDQDVSRFIRDALIEKLDRLAAENKTVARALRALAA